MTRVPDARLRPLLLVVLLAGLSILFFDVGPLGASQDDWLYRWSVQKLAGSHRLVFFPDDSVLPFVQVTWSYVVGIGHTSPQVLRLTMFPYWCGLGVAVYLCGRQLGARRDWAAIAAVSVVCNPIVMTLATSYMTDTVYLALWMGVAAAGAHWMRSGRGMVMTLPLVALCTLQRPPGAASAMALTLGLAVARRSRPVRGREWVVLAGAWVVALGAIAIPMMAGLGTPVETHRLYTVTLQHLDNGLEAMRGALPVVGLLLLPLAGALWLERAAVPKPRSRTAIFIVGLCLGFGLAVPLATGTAPRALPGPYLTTFGLGPPNIGGSKRTLYPAVLLVLLNLAVVATFLLEFWIRGGNWVLSRLAAPGVFVVAMAASHFLPMLITGAADRYMLPIAIPLVPLVASHLRAASRGSVRWAAAVVAVGLVAYLAGQQDYQAWQVARDLAAQQAYQTAPPSRVDAGYEANGVYWELPLYDMTGFELPRDPVSQVTQAASGPTSPTCRLYFAGPDDPRTGIRYESLSPGKVVVSCMAAGPRS